MALQNSISNITRRVLLAAAASAALALPAIADDTIKLGLVAAMSGQSAKSGEAIVRGLSVAIDEINAKGGVLGKKLELVVRDDESNPAKGVVAARELVQREKVAALFGGLDTPVSMAIVPFANQNKVPFMGVWAAGTPITRNGAPENYVFRVSAVDALVDKALVAYAIKKYGAKKPGMILINNPWGESNEKGLKAALEEKGMPFAGIEKFQDADVDVVQRFHFVEYGIITFLFYRAWRALEDPAILLLPALAGLLVGTADEWLQWFIPNRVGEIADILLNGIAIGCGLLFSVGADPPARFTWSMRPGSILRVGRLAAATVVALALFVHIVHLGDDINDREVGVFKSRYSMTALPALAAAKRAEWQMHPPPLTLQRVSREDQYMTEGVTHVQRRNELLGADQAKGAWMENLILEKYYAPVLDTPSYVSRTGHRWSAEQRASVDVRAAGSDPSYVSTANPYPIFAWSRSVFWVASGIAAAAVWIAARLAERSIHPRSEASTAV